MQYSARRFGLHKWRSIDFVIGERPKAVDVNGCPTTSFIGIARVMKEEIGDLIVQAQFGGLPERVHVEGECIFRKGYLA